MSVRINPVIYFFAALQTLVVSCGPSGTAPLHTAGEKSAATVSTSPGAGVEVEKRKSLTGAYRLPEPHAKTYKTEIDKPRARRGLAEMEANGVELSADLEIDDRLNDAAQTISDMSRAGFLVTTPVAQETMWWHGIPESAHGVALFQEGDASALEERLDEWLERQADEGYSRFGAVMNKIEGGVEATVIVVKSQIDLLPVPRRVSGPRKLRIEGRADRYYKAASLSVTRPDGSSFEPKTKNKSGSFVSTVQLTERGVWQIEILGDGAAGPTTLANFPVAVGVPVGGEVVFKSFDLESRRPRKLERMLFDLINKEREKAGLEPLGWSDNLADVARGYSKEMARTGAVAHISKISGSVADRVLAAGIEFATVCENLAKAATVEETHAGLMRSPAHRANILNGDLEKVGIGVEIDDGENGTNLYVTQIFSRDRRPIDPESTATQVIEMINRKREELGRGKIEEHKWLKREAEKFSKGCFANDPPKMGAFQGLFKSVKAFYVKTNSENINLSALKDLYSSEQTDLGIYVKEGKDPAMEGEAVCITVLLGSR